jgi:signal peptidase I
MEINPSPSPGSNTNPVGQPLAPNEPLPTPNPPNPSQPPSWGRETIHSLVSTIGLFLTAFSIAIFLNTFVIQSYQVDGQSMEKTLQNDDRLIVNKVPRTLARITHHQYVPKRGQIIIFNQAGLPGFIGEKQLIKRVIGLPGDRVVIRDGHITIYNSEHPGGFNPDASGLYHIDATQTVGDVDIKLQKDELFVCGDNRGNSEDSRYFGPIKTDQVVARLVLRILPLNKAQSF